MRGLVKPLLMFVLAGLLLFGQGRASVSSGGMLGAMPQASASLLAERALAQWLGGPVALCLPERAPPLPDQPEHDPACGLCCLPTGARGLALPPVAAVFLPPPPVTPLVWQAPMPVVAARVAPPQPLQPRAPPGGV